MKRLPHVLLVGAGAERFARETGAESGQLLTPGQSRKFRDWTRANKPHCRTTAELAWAAARTLKTKGTVVYLARDVRGNLAAGTSTSGWAYRYPGRLGDSPIIGAGLYADTRYGACGCTHVGEMTIRCATARSVVLYMKMGASVTEACTEALTDLRDLKGGFLGRVMLHAMDREGHCCVAATHRMPARFRACRWREGSDGPARVPATVPVDFR
jgi:L-asparaginase